MDSTDQDVPAGKPEADTLTDALRQLAPGSHMLNALQLIIDTHTIVTVTDPAGRIIYANDRFCEVSKHSREDLIGQTHSIVRSDRHPSSFYEGIWSTISSGNVWNGDIQNKAKDGSFYRVQTTISPIFDNKNRIAGYGSIQTDVTAQRQSMVDEPDNEREFLNILRTAIDSIESSLCVIDPSGKVLFANKAQGELYPDSVSPTGSLIDLHEMVRQRLPDLTKVEIDNYVKDIFTTGVKEQRSLTDGRIVQVVRTITDDGYMIGHHTDITKLVKQNELLEDQAASIELMKAIAVDANESADADSAYARCLERICEFTGWEVGHVYLPCNDERGRCRPADYWYSTDSGDFTPFQIETERTVFELGQGLPGRVFQSGNPAWMHDVTADFNFLRSEAAQRSGIKGGAAFPVKIRTKVVAILEFYSTQPIEPNPKLEQILSHVCTQMSQVVERDSSEKLLMTRITAELRKRDKELVEQNQRLDAALKNMTQGLCMFDSEQRLIVSNQRYAEMYDLPPGVMKPSITLREIIEYRIANGIYAGENPEEYIQERMAWVSSGVHSSKIQNLSDGRAIAITHQPMSDGGWLTTHEDITERVKSENALLESQELFSRVFHASPASLAISSPDGTILDVNEAWSAMLGISREEAMAKTAHELGFWVDISERERFVEVINKDGAAKEIETLLQTRDGRLINVVSWGERVEVGGTSRLLFVSLDITERKKAEEALQESQELLSKAFRASPAAMAISNPLNGTHIDVNETWMTMLGYSREQAMQSSVLDLGIWADPKARERFIKQIGSEGSLYGFDTKFKTKDGRLLDVLVSGEQVEIGGEQRLLVVSYDITNRKMAEAALRESENKFKALVESTNVVPWEFDPETMRFTYVGPQVVSLFGYPVEDWYTEGFWETSIHPDDREKTVRICTEATNLCLDHDFEYRVMTANGGVVWVRDVVSVVAHGGKAKSLRGVIIDISDRKKSSEALERSEQRFKDIVEVSSDWIWECDENLRFTYFSERFTQVTGVPKDRVLGKKRQEIGMDLEGGDWESHLADLEARRSFRAFSYAVKDENGDTRHWMVNGRPVFDENDNFMGYRGTGADRTMEVRAEAELRRHRDHLQDLVNDATVELKQRADELRLALAKEKELNELQSQFVSMASHEFRTPLAIIDGAAQRLKRRAGKLSPEDTSKRVEKIRGAVARMTQLMESTLVAARLEAGRPTIQIEPCDISSVLREICDRQQDIAENHVISCKVNDLPNVIQADRTAIEQVFTNLLSNAVKYAQNAPDIELKAHLDGETVIIQVRDYGIGIDEEDLPNMFQRFFRARTSTGIAGTGIGLNLVKTLVELHDGSVSVESKKGEGSLFSVRLPIEGPAATNQSEGQAA